MAIAHLRQHPSYQQRAVVVSALSEDHRPGEDQSWEVLFEELFSMGVPYVAASGTGPTDSDIVAVPMVIESPDMPIINVGAVNEWRMKTDYTPAGPHVTIYAPGGIRGEGLPCQGKVDRQELQGTGTSIGEYPA